MLFSISQNFSLKLQQMASDAWGRRSALPQTRECKLISKPLLRNLNKGLQRARKGGTARVQNSWLCAAPSVRQRQQNAQIVFDHAWDSHGTLKYGAGCPPSAEIPCCVCPEVQAFIFDRRKLRQGGTRVFSDGPNEKRYPGQAGVHSFAHTAPSSSLRRQSRTSPKN